MHRLITMRAFRLVLVATFFVALGSIQAADLDPKAINVQLPKDIKWVASPSGSEQAILTGDPSKPGLYVVLTKWLPNKNSRPHSHPNDRFITVLKGTWWVNTGANYDPAGMKPVPAGSFVVHYGGQIHYDGAKDEECILQIVGMGPATSTSAERK
jgi:quercetin dioxygenase-like cupin family protein